MRYATFPALDREVSRLGFGALGFAGWFGERSDDEWIQALHAALGAGVNFIDTARAAGSEIRADEVDDDAELPYDWQEDATWR